MNSRLPPPKPNSLAPRPRVFSLNMDTRQNSSPEDTPDLDTAPKPGGVSSLTQAFEAKMRPSTNHFLHVSESRSRSNSTPTRPQYPLTTLSQVNVTSPRRGSIQDNSEVDETPLAYNEIKARFQQAANHTQTATNPVTFAHRSPPAFDSSNRSLAKESKSIQQDAISSETDISRNSIEDVGTERNPFLGSDEEVCESSEDSQSDTERSSSVFSNRPPEIILPVTKSYVPSTATVKRRPPAPPPLRKLGSNNTEKSVIESQSDNQSVSNNHSSISLSRTNSSNGSTSPSVASPRINRPRGYTHGSTSRVHPDEKVLRNLDQMLRNHTTSFSESTPDITITSSSNIYKPTPPLPGRPRSYSSESLTTRPSIDSTVSGQEHKNLEKRSKVIQELVDTEVSYLHDLTILDKIYYQQAQKSDVFHSRDLKTLFCNLPEVIEFTQEFCELLKAACEPSAEAERTSKWVGEAFSLMMGSLETVYCNYCKAHESAVIRLNELQSNRGANDFFESCKEEMKGQTTSWDFGSLLIKPVQRVLKYPLLLQQILVLTPETDPDFSHLKSANQDIQKVAERINEIKKRKDIVETIVGIKKKDVVLSHGINKRISRRTQQIKQKAGLQDATTDLLFDHFLAKFEHQQCEAKNLVTQIENWKCKVQEYLDLQMKFAEMMERMYVGDNFGVPSKRGLQSQAKEYRLSMTKVYMEAQRRLDSSIKTLIVPRVEEFLNLFQKPYTVIKKREHKLLDYDRARGIKLKGDKPDAALEKSANDYLAINAQLQDELPKFFGLTTQYFNVLVEVIASIQATFYQGLARELEHVHQFLVPQGSQSGDLENIVQDYHQSLEHEGGFRHQLNDIQLLTRDNNSSRSRSSLDSSSITSVPLGRTLSLQSSYLSDSEVASRFESADPESQSIKSRKNYPSLSPQSVAGRVQQPMARSVSHGNPPSNFRSHTGQPFDDPFMAPEEISSGPDSYWSPEISPDRITNTTVSPPLSSRNINKMFKCTVIYPFQAEHPDEIDLSLGSILLVSKTESDEKFGTMWYGEDLESGQIGWFPSSHCTLID